MAKRSRKSRRSSASSPNVVQSSVPPLTLSREDMDTFADQYAYVYYDARTLLAVTVLMVILMAGLAYVI
jgi:hypothetical protein